MRVALVCPYSCTVPGGVQAQVLGLARALCEAGDEVIVVAPSDPTPGTDGGLGLSALGGAVFVRVGGSVPIPVNGSRAPVSPWPTTMARTVAALRRFRPEIIHVHEPLVPGPALAAMASGSVPIVATFHRSGADRAYRVFGHLLGAVAERLAATFAVSEQARTTARLALGRHAGGLEIVANGVEVERLAVARPTPSAGPTVVFVGRHEPRKGLGVLLEAFASLPADSRLWVLGSGPETAELTARARADGRITWLGSLDEAERAARVAGADVLCAPSLSGESFGVVLLEAMAAGTAVVASDLPGYRLAAGGAARLVDPSDARALARALADVLSDEAGRGRLVAAGRRRAADCSMERVASRYRRVYEQLSTGRGTR